MELESHPQTPALAEHFGPVPVTLGRIPTDPASVETSTRDTVVEMSRVAQASARHPVVQRAVQEALAPLPRSWDIKERVKAVYAWVQHRVEFTDDEGVLARVWGYAPEDAEMIVHPELLLSMPKPMGDCDDQSTLLASMLLHLPVGVRFVTVAADPEQPDRWSHVYVRVALPCDEVMALDPSHGAYAGWEESNVFRRKEWIVKEKPMVGCGCEEPRVGLKGIGVSGLGIAWSDIFKTGTQQAITAGTKVLEAQAVPPRGTFISRTPEGEVIQTAGRFPQAGISTFPPMQFSTGGGDITMWLLIGIGVIVLAKGVKG